MNVYYEENCGSYVVANNKEEVKTILLDLYIILKTELQIKQCDIYNEGYYIGKELFVQDYTFGEIIDKFKEFDNNYSFDEFKIYKTRNNYRIWESFYKILKRMDLIPSNTIDEPFEIFNGDE